MSTSTYVHIHICSYAHMLICAYVHIHICSHQHMFICTYADMCICPFPWCVPAGRPRPAFGGPRGGPAGCRLCSRPAGPPPPSQGANVHNRIILPLCYLARGKCPPPPHCALMPPCKGQMPEPALIPPIATRYGANPFPLKTSRYLHHSFTICWYHKGIALMVVLP